MCSMQSGLNITTRVLMQLEKKEVSEVNIPFLRHRMIWGHGNFPLEIFHMYPEAFRS